MKATNPFGTCGVTRRQFLTQTGMGFTGVALGAMLFKDGVLRANEAPAFTPPNGQPQFTPRAKSVIWIFLIGGLSHLESFDVKPELNKYAGKLIEDTPHKGVVNDALIKQNLPNIDTQKRDVYKKIMALNTGYRTYGQSGLVVSDWFPHLGSCADDLAVVRSFWTIDNNHGAQLTFHTGRNVREGAHPTIGSWVTYGLGSLTDNLPEFVVIGEPSADCCGGVWTHGAAYLGPQYSGVRLNTDPSKPLAFIKPADATMTPEEQEHNFSLLGKLNRLSGIDYPDDEFLRARIKSYELAFQMQTAIPDTLGLQKETEATKKMYGLDQKETETFGQQCLVARRMVERGVRFIQLFHGGIGSAGAWDSHRDIKINHTKLSKQVDQPIAALIKDLKQRGLLDDTLVVIGTEFGRTPGADFFEKAPGTGRDHHPHGFTCVLAGGGTKGGIVHGATDELGFHAVENRHYVTDLHATVLHQMGLDSRKLQYPGRQRLDMDYGEVIKGVLA
ncbi:MAG TPA: DUF1501 domain-containing protein [Verrucomicrobiae bacterium]|jgi:hypothetical protein